MSAIVDLTVQLLWPAGGNKRARGTVSVNGTLSQRRVVLFHGSSGPQPLQPIRSTWSAADGAYSFDRIANGTYFGVAFPVDGDSVNAEVIYPMTLEPME